MSGQGVSWATSFNANWRMGVCKAGIGCYGCSLVPLFFSLLFFLLFLFSNPLLGGISLWAILLRVAARWRTPSAPRMLVGEAKQRR